MSRGSESKALQPPIDAEEPKKEIAVKAAEASQTGALNKDSQDSDTSDNDSADGSSVDIESRVHEALDELDPSLQAILNVRFGLHNGQPSSSSEIAKHIGVKDSQVKSLEDEALRVLMGYYKRNGKPPPDGYSQ